MNNKCNIGLLLFPGITPLDIVGPAEVFSSVSDIQVHFVWKDTNPIKTGSGWYLVPTIDFENAPQFDVICIPGGNGQITLMDDTQTLEFIKTQAKNARFITSVCTGSLILGAAGLLIGYKATCHWMSLDQLSLLGAIPVKQRVVQDRNRITGAGITAGIDFALMLIAKLYGEKTARMVQLRMEYNPKPPLDAGSPDKVSVDEITELVNKVKDRQQKRYLATIEASKKLKI